MEDIHAALHVLHVLLGDVAAQIPKALRLRGHDGATAPLEVCTGRGQGNRGQAEPGRGKLSWAGLGWAAPDQARPAQP